MNYRFSNPGSCATALVMGAVAGLIYLIIYPPNAPSEMWITTDPGSYYRMAGHPFRPEYLPFVLRPAIPLIVRAIPLPTCWSFAVLNVLSLALLTALVERLGALLSRPVSVRLGAGALVCTILPVSGAFRVPAMIDIPVLCLVVGTVLSVHAGLIRIGFILTIFSAFSHPLGFMMGLGVLASRSRKVALTSAALGVALLTGYYFLMGDRILPYRYAPKPSVVFQGTAILRSVLTTLVYSIGPLPVGLAVAPRTYRRLVSYCLFGIVVAIAGASAWGRFLGFLCPLLAPLALHKVTSSSPVAIISRWLLFPVAMIATGSLFLLPNTVPLWTPPSKMAGGILLILSAAAISCSCFLEKHRAGLCPSLKE